MKKILSLLLCLSLIFVVSGCAKIDETWRNLTGEPEPLDIEWQTSEGDLEVSPDGSGVIKQESSVKHIDDTKIEVPEYKTNAMKFVINDAQYGSRNITTRYEKVNIDFQGFVEGIIQLKDSVSDEEMLVASKKLVELLNSNFNMGLTIGSEGNISQINDLRKDIIFEDLNGYNISIVNDSEFQSSVSLECLPMSVKTKSDVLEFLTPFGEKLGIDLFDDSDFINALNGITYEVPIGDLETKEYNHLYISLFDDGIDEEVLVINILGTVDSEEPFYKVSLDIKLSQPRYEDIKAGL